MTDWIDASRPGGRPGISRRPITKKEARQHRQSKRRPPKGRWAEIVQEVRARANWRCECSGECGASHVDSRCHVLHEDADGLRLTTAHLRRSVCKCEPLCALLDHVKAMCWECHKRYDGTIGAAVAAGEPQVSPHIQPGDKFADSKEEDVTLLVLQTWTRRDNGIHMARCARLTPPPHKPGLVEIPTIVLTNDYEAVRDDDREPTNNATIEQRIAAIERSLTDIRSLVVQFRSDERIRAIIGQAVRDELLKAEAARAWRTTHA